MNIARNIQALRASKGVTQEQLAQALGVSAPAVSKWEGGHSCPDLMLIAPLARYFGVSTDELLDFEPKLGEAGIEALADALADDFHAGLERAEALRCEYPMDAELSFRLACILQGQFIHAPDDAALDKARALLRALLEQAESASNGGLFKRRCQFLLAMSRLNDGEVAEARALLEALSTEDDVRPEQLLPTIQLREGDFAGAERAAARRLFGALNDAILSLLTMAKAAIKQDDPERAARYAGAQEALARLFHLIPAHGMTVAQTLDITARATGNRAQLLRAVAMTADFLENGMRAPVDWGPLLERAELTGALTDRQRAAMIHAYLQELGEEAAYAPLVGCADFESVRERLARLLVKTQGDQA
ncbi:helix-turn-helix domain-containing protein [Bacillota bacterium Meth-B3]